MDYIKTYEELNTLLPFSPYVKVQQDQPEKMAMMDFLAALLSKYDSIKAQIMSSPKISSSKKHYVEYFAQTPPHLLLLLLR